MNRYQYFTPKELACRCGTCGMGEWDMDPRFMHKVVDLRKKLAFPFIVTSAIRCPTYNDSIYVDRGHDMGMHLDGPHVSGHALDLKLYGHRAFELLAYASQYGMSGVGISQRGPREHRFIHMDDLQSSPAGPRAWVWSY